MIYLDNAATTMVTEEVFEKMKPYFISKYANPSSVYSFAADVKKDIDMARQSVAKLINADTDEIFFTAGGSESDNWALKMVARKYRDKGKHIITSKIEHHAVLHTCEYLEKKGFEISYIDVDENGVIKLDELKAAIRDDTILISVMAANNEIGTIQPLVKIGEIAKENRILFHTDAVQALGHIPWRGAGERKKSRNIKYSGNYRFWRCRGYCCTGYEEKCEKTDCIKRLSYRQGAC